jgi:hypothetical protein
MAMSAVAQRDLDQLHAKWRKARIEELTEFDVQTLAEHVADLERERLELIDSIEDQEHSIEQLQEDLKDANVEKWEGLLLAAQEVVAAGYNRAEVISYEQRQFGVRVVLDVDMTPGEALMSLTPGWELTLSGALTQEFSALEKEI